MRRVGAAPFDMPRGRPAPLPSLPTVALFFHHSFVRANPARQPSCDLADQCWLSGHPYPLSGTPSLKSG